MRFIINSQNHTRIVNGKKNIHPAVSELVRLDGMCAVASIVPKKDREAGEHICGSPTVHEKYCELEDGSFLIRTNFLFGADAASVEPIRITLDKAIIAANA